MMKRRRFLQYSALTASAMMLPRLSDAQPKLLNNIGIGLFSLPKMLEKDFRGAMSMLSKMGYTEIEMYGPYPFSVPAAQARWNSVTPALGFSGSGYFGLSVNEVKSILKENKISVPSIHTDLGTLREAMPKLGEAASQLGFEYVVLPAIPDDERKTLDDYKRLADDFNKMGAEAKKNNVKFAYHNHGYGFSEKEGKIPFHVLAENTDPNVVFLQMDLFWTIAGGADPVALFDKYPKRYVSMHVKDMKAKKTFSGDGGDSGQWIELFPNMTTAGNGVLDLKTILTKAKASGVKHFFVEQDMVAEPEVALKKSIDYLKTI